jgi:hypothetical protein
MGAEATEELPELSGVGQRSGRDFLQLPEVRGHQLGSPGRVSAEAAGVLNVCRSILGAALWGPTD